MPHDIATGRFHFDDIRAIVGHDLRGQGTDYDRGEINDAHAFKRSAGSPSALLKRARVHSNCTIIESDNG